MSFWRIVALAGVVFCVVSFSKNKSSKTYHIVDIDKIGPIELERVKSNPQIEWWSEVDSKMLVLSSFSVLNIEQSYQSLNIKPVIERLYLVRNGHSSSLANMDVDTIISGGKVAVVQARSDKVPEVKCLYNIVDGVQPHSHAGVFIFESNKVLVKQVKNSFKSRKKFTWKSSVLGNLDSLDGERWFQANEKLASFHRNTHGTSIKLAREWLTQQLSQLPNMEVSLQEFKLGSTSTYNIIGKLTGSERPEDWYVVGGHYDSISQLGTSIAPGAEDNASGSAGVLEIARVFSEHPPAATMLFILFSGEEQGLYGSKAHVGKIAADGELSKLKAVINMDMIGYTKSETLGVLLETEEVATDLMESLKASAEEFTDLEVSTTFNAWGSDHVPYLRKQVPAVLTIDRDWGAYPAYHKDTDIIENVVPEMGIEILKMNIATLSQLAGD